ncbi:hypothetical protein JCM7447_14650 [Corynebacterium amycolatum]
MAVPPTTTNANQVLTVMATTDNADNQPFPEWDSRPARCSRVLRSASAPVGIL